ncbi:hypothetical protein K438DRAFT_1979034 [Mycena galopus ATCC 62051]|nr:hypothetical protein K438DRAFT_1979034 [Mycena galopus ATCC 62051]
MSLDNSPFAYRLNMNYIPLDSEILEIRALLVDPADELLMSEIYNLDDKALSCLIRP